jgi:antitoxin (DNA-binding transcriptional repressor) of toxin-antitoxin stability system
MKPITRVTPYVRNTKIGLDKLSMPRGRATRPLRSVKFKKAESRSACRSTSCYTQVMDREITQRQLRNDSGEIMRGLDEGHTYVVTRNGVPVGELTPLRRHRFVNTEAVIATFKGAPSVDLNRLRSDLDDVASQDMKPRV